METRATNQLSLPFFQPASPSNKTAHINDLVCVDLRYRKEEGIKKYGIPLQASNGHDALVDAYEEALDMCQYLKQAIVERNNEQKAVAAKVAG
jgi:hypothetical protein